MLSLTGLNQKSTYGLMVKRLRRCPLTAESAVRFRMGLPKKRRQRLLASFFCSPCKESTRQTRFAVVRIRVANLAEGFPLAGNGKFRMELRYDYKKFLESARQTRFAVVRIRASESCRGIPACGKQQIPQMITNKKHLESTRQTRFAVVRQFAARQFFTKEHNSSAFLWIIRLTFPKSYYIIET